MIDQETRNRIRVALAAYAYEMEAKPIISDAEFDSLAKSIDQKASTVKPYHDKKTADRYARLDRFFAEEFSPDTGQWIHKHPELDLVKSTYERLYA